MAVTDKRNIIPHLTRAITVKTLKLSFWATGRHYYYRNQMQSEDSISLVSRVTKH